MPEPGVHLRQSEAFGRTAAGQSNSVSETRDLHHGEPVWCSYPVPALDHAPLRESLKVDLVIVGAGITGALLAEAASRTGLSTLVLDRRSPGAGSTAASTALIQFEIDTPLLHLADKIGFEPARRVWLRSYRAVQALAHLITANVIPCDLRRRHAVYLSGNLLPPAALAEEGRLRRRIGLPSERLPSERLRERGLQGDAALISAGAAELNPLALTRGLLSIAQKRGVRLCAPTALAAVQASSRGVSMATAEGHEIEAAALVYATGYELADGVPSAGHRRTSTWAFATRPQPAPLREHQDIVWEASTPYLYMRSTIDGRLVVGGEDAPFDDETRRDALLPRKIAALRAELREARPSVDTEADYAWAGTFGESEDGLPSIGLIPGAPNCYAVLGYGGNGITFGRIAAELILAMLQGRRDPLRDDLDFR